ncbi:MAG: Ni,Fe-hydrogenase I large subunit, partial [Proteobacteria bacterium]|nr:Ni,Fe-hydrogenase I large subunit [Pseudomonadota bacterium]
MSIIPLMYNICGSAQSQAALISIQQAQQLDPDPKLQIARNMLLLVEIAREHLLRIFLDWPKLF